MIAKRSSSRSRLDESDLDSLNPWATSRKFSHWTLFSRFRDPPRALTIRQPSKNRENIHAYEVFIESNAPCPTGANWDWLGKRSRVRRFYLIKLFAPEHSSRCWKIDFTAKKWKLIGKTTFRFQPRELLCMSTDDRLHSVYDRFYFCPKRFCFIYFFLASGHRAISRIIFPNVFTVTTPRESGSVVMSYW